MDKLFKNLFLTLFPIAAFLFILLVNNILTTNARYGNVISMIQFYGTFVIGIASVFILELIGLFLQIKKNYFSATAWLTGAFESALLVIAPLVPALQNNRIIQSLHYKNTGLSIFICLHFVSIYLFMFFFSKNTDTHS